MIEHNTTGNEWDVRFLRLAREVSTWGKDPSTKCGAVAVRDRLPLVMGYNGFARGLSDTAERLNNREEKYSRTIHAEENVICNSSRHGISLVGATLYVYGLPICGNCAPRIIQVGIKRIVGIEMDPEKAIRWAESCAKAEADFAEAGVIYSKIKLV